MWGCSFSAVQLAVKLTTVLLQGFHPDDFQRGRRGGNQGPAVHPDMMQPGPTDYDSMFS